jgi:hypothetical protein
MQAEEEGRGNRQSTRRGRAISPGERVLGG